jgi:hypothetical protein
MIAKRHGPTILTGAGIIGGVVTTVLVARAAVKAQPTVQVTREQTQEIMTKELDENYTKKDRSSELGKVYITATQNMLRIYWPAVTIGVASIACVLTAHGMMRKNYTALAAAYTALDAGFKAYRKRVEDEFGREKEMEIYTGRRTVESVDEDGKPCVINEKYDGIFPSVYGRFFDATSPSWEKNAEYNKIFLHAQQMWANDRLRSRGHLFLNEVYEALGLEWSQAGQHVGWKLDGDGDGFVDFGIYEIGDESSRSFVNGVEPVIFLDFNVDGPIRIS